MGQTEDSSEKPREDNLQCRVHSEFWVNISEATGKKNIKPNTDLYILLLNQFYNFFFFFGLIRDHWASKTANTT